MDNFNEDDFESYTLDYDRIINSKKFLSVTRLTAAQFKANPYRTVGEFFKDLSDEDLETLCEVCDNYHDAQEEDTEFTDVPHFEEILLIGEMLAAGEGILDRTLDDVMKRTNHMMFYLAVESLSRKGLVRVHHENFSFGDDYGDKVVVERIEGMDYE